MRKSAFSVFAISLLVSAMFSVNGEAAGKTVGIIMTGNTPYYKEIHRAFTESLAAEGFQSGSLDVLVQTPVPEPISWTNAVRKLIAVGVDVLVTYGAPATLTAAAETSELPIVFAGVYDPAALNIRGKNVTGMSSKVPVASLVRYLRSITPFTKLGVVYNEAEKDTVLQANEVKQLEGANTFQSVRFSVSRPDQVAKIGNVDAVLLTSSCAVMQCMTNVIGVVRKARIPTGTTIGGGEQTGVVVTLSPSPAEQGREAARMVARVLRGTPPSALPVETPKKIELIINLKEANELGLKVPMDLLTTATSVIR